MKRGGGGGIKGRVSPQRRGSEKIEREKEKERESIHFYFIHCTWEVDFLNQSVLFNHLCPSISCLIFPLWIFNLFLEINCVDQEFLSLWVFEPHNIYLKYKNKISLELQHYLWWIANWVNFTVDIPSMKTYKNFYLSKIKYVAHHQLGEGQIAYKKFMYSAFRLYWKANLRQKHRHEVPLYIFWSREKKKKRYSCYSLNRQSI